MSVFLLLTYIIGLAHSLIPHCHNHSGDGHSAELHQHAHHHSHDSVQAHYYAQDYTCVDSTAPGLFALMSNWLGAMEHPFTECNIENYVPLNAADGVSDLLKLKQVLICIVLFAFAEPEDELHLYTDGDALLYKSPHLYNSPLRGPPVLSC